MSYIARNKKTGREYKFNNVQDRRDFCLHMSSLKSFTLREELKQEN